MQYLGIDVHSSASVWCLLDNDGQLVERGRVATTRPALMALAEKLSDGGPILAGHEVGTQVYLVHDAFSDAGVKIEAFNAAHLRMIAASRKKTDKRDSYWIARALQTGMKPHPVYIPRGHVREIRGLLAQREAVVEDLKRWRLRARAQLRARGVCIPRGSWRIDALVDQTLESPDGVDTDLLAALGLCDRTTALFTEELAELEAELAARVQGNEVVERLRTIPGFGKLVSACFYATICEVERFSNARSLTSYVGLVPSIRQTGDVAHLGHISKEGSPRMRRLLVQAAHTVIRSSRADAQPLRSIYQRIQANKKRKKIAVIALARHLAKIAYHVWKDETEYNPKHLRCSET